MFVPELAAFYECKQCDIIFKVVFFVVENLNRHIYKILPYFFLNKVAHWGSVIFFIVWSTIMCSLQLFTSFANKTTIVQGNQKYRPLIFIFVIYVTISSRHRCMFF